MIDVFSVISMGQCNVWYCDIGCEISIFDWVTCTTAVLAPDDLSWGDDEEIVVVVVGLSQQAPQYGDITLARG